MTKTATPYPPLHSPRRILMGPGPSDVPQTILAALAQPTVGHLDPFYLQAMDGLQSMLRHVFKTDNELTFAVSGTGSAGMETAVVNLVEPGDSVLICVNGVFGSRMADVAERAGAVVNTITKPWGQIFTTTELKNAIVKFKPKIVGIVMAETSTGASQPISAIADVVHNAGGLLIVDAVTSLGGMNVEVDQWGIDVVFSGTQKCLSCPPGLAPISFSPAAVASIERRATKVSSWYFDVSMIANYWGENRAYHHTAPINMTFALYEALRLLLAEGLEACYARHALNHRALKRGLEILGFTYAADPEHQLPMLNAVNLPAAVDDAQMRLALLEQYKIEIGGGLGELKGKVWRIGIMGHSAKSENVLSLLEALENLFVENRIVCESGVACRAANAVYLNG
ncbi:MAG: alanine--glyoxylate aminotransferase family protein [Planctomycetaceae bacterium]|jgi:alanine-glyoxylate transaminase / serine-glyoxylate transaminase / serine-pyruvate transaminase|nr:alanine--glyoxylate aminotransferase family protein [Planctomycetaceae bacterium]MBT4010731.1 alanine--glyoxylate aminotransferase family protein [Planctomycetaceae bacterium]MBT4725477.1 alanine--glyoxylate aminotransferase family protein [Planctomycetaceae bacterium]MBT4845768.1 alanine--glyoxylate aminotransferase family protein [Planctomycetaceae bacterium]MBT5125479.1 alanine--glyoxylate aminotransferase family protein [Planctomycetaceae bacterium]